MERTSWYLAIDQFGYLTFARDLAHGRVFHRWEALRAIAPLLPPGVSVDVLAQTYVLREGLLYCRYAPGFPLLLALATPFGETALHAVSPLALLGLLVCLFAFGRRLLGSPWLALAAALLAVILPSYLLQWSISPLRDVPAHLVAVGALALVTGEARTRRRAGLAGVLLGLAGSIRVDALLYLLPAGALWWARGPWPRRAGAALAAGLLLGLAPLLAYDWVATGNPLRPTQMMEARGLVASAKRPEPAGDDGRVWRLPWPARAEAREGPPGRRRLLLQGGGLRLSHLRRTLPQNLSLLAAVFGPLAGALALVGALAAVVGRRPAAALVGYSAVAVPFFSLWVRPDPRYLAGVLLAGALLAVDGAAWLAERPARAGRRWRWPLAVAVAVAAAALAWADTGGPGARSVAALALACSLAVGAPAAAALADTGSRRRALAVPLGLALFAVLSWRAAAGLGFRARFQRPEVERARATLGAALEPPAIVLTSDTVGRPAENINYYTPADALYERELARWGVHRRFFLNSALRRGFHVYLLLPPSEADRWLAAPTLRPWFRLRVVARIPPERAAEFFVASPVHRGVPLVLVRAELRTAPRASAKPSEPREETERARRGAASRGAGS